MRLEGLQIARCRSCRARVVWTTNTATGKRMPVDAEPMVGGNVMLTAGNDGPRSTTVGRDEQRERAGRREELYVSHFATCADSDQWRRS